jgi:hypothetical protein
MKASLVAYDFMELFKKLEIKIENGVCERLPKIGNDPNLVAQILGIKILKNTFGFTFI